MQKAKEVLSKLWNSYRNWLGDVVWYKNWKVWLSVVVVLMLGAFGDSDEPEVEAEANEPEIEEVVEKDNEEPEEPEEIEEKQRSESDLINEINEVGENTFKDKYTKASILWDIENAVYHEDGSYNPDESLIDAINIETFLNGSEIGNFLMPATAFLEEIQEMEFNRVHISADGKFVDQYGKESNQNAVYLVISKETMEKINFDNFNWRNLPDIADDFWMHQSMRTKGL